MIHAQVLPNVPRLLMKLLLFPTGKSWCREEDHLALIIELLGEFPRSLLTSGKFCPDFFTKKGDLKRIQQLNFWCLRDVLREKYKFPDPDAREAAEFLESLLVIDPSKRATAADCLSHPWLALSSGEPPLLSPRRENCSTVAGVANSTAVAKIALFDDDIDAKGMPKNRYFENKHFSS